MFGQAKRWAKGIKRDVVALYLAARDPRTPKLAKALAFAVAAYAVSPVDLIPDFIPVLGYLDDLIILPLGIMLAVRLIPPPLMAEFRHQATQTGRLPVHWLGPVLIGGIWAAGLIALAVYLWR